MPARYDLTWDPENRRWRIQYGGKRYVVSCRQLGVPDTKEASYRAANLWWFKKKQELDGEIRWPHHEILEDLITERDKALDIGAFPEAEEIHRKIVIAAGMADEPQEDVEAMIASEHPGNVDASDHALSRMEMARKAGIVIPEGADTELIKYIFGDVRIDLDRHHRRPRAYSQSAPGKQSVTSQVGKYLNLEESRLKSNLLSISEFDTIRRCLHEFRDWIGGDNVVEVLEADKIEAWWSHLMGQGISIEYKKKKLRFAKSFIGWLVEKGQIKLPTNLHSRRHRFGGGAKAIPTIPVDDAKKLILAAPGQLQLHLFLMANCGMTQQDISDLKPIEVNWQTGRIERKRSKTEAHKDVPIVNYLLWPETWGLLQQFGKREGDHALMTESGRTWVRDFIKADGKRSKVDAIKSNYVHLTGKTKLVYPMKLFRKTSATLLEKHHGENIVTMFLGHAPNTVATRHYSAPDQTKFDAAVKLLRLEYGFG